VDLARHARGARRRTSGPARRGPAFRPAPADRRRSRPTPTRRPRRAASAARRLTPGARTAEVGAGASASCSTSGSRARSSSWPRRSARSSSSMPLGRRGKIRTVGSTDMRASLSSTCGSRVSSASASRPSTNARRETSGSTPRATLHRVRHGGFTDRGDALRQLTAAHWRTAPREVARTAPNRPELPGAGRVLPEIGDDGLRLGP
jgi:hypothetical protein